MATRDDRLALPHPTDAIRVVPLATIDDIALATADAPKTKTAPPKLTYRGGPLIANVEVFTIFWGKGWSLAANKTTATALNAFFDKILTSPLLGDLAEYSTATTKIGKGKRTGTVTITTPNVKLTVSDGAIQHFLQQQVSAGTVPVPNPNTLLFVYLPPGVSVTQGGAKSCQAFCGYHNHIHGRIFYAVMPYPTCKGCTGGLSAFDSLTSTSSHELCEAITDAVPGTGWYDDANGEIGDICAWKTKTIAGYTVQKEWSNAKSSCA